MSFHVGQKVVCITPRWRCCPSIVQPQKGVVYTVASVLVDPSDGMQQITVAEIANQHTWGAPGFRPLVERKTDISIFTAMLDPSNHTPLPEQQPRRQKVSHDGCGNE